MWWSILEGRDKRGGCRDRASASTIQPPCSPNIVSEWVGLQDRLGISPTDRGRWVMDEAKDINPEDDDTHK